MSFRGFGRGINCWYRFVSKARYLLFSTESGVTLGHLDESSLGWTFCVRHQYTLLCRSAMQWTCRANYRYSSVLSRDNYSITFHHVLARRHRILAGLWLFFQEWKLLVGEDTIPEVHGLSDLEVLLFRILVQVASELRLVLLQGNLFSWTFFRKRSFVCRRHLSYSLLGDPRHGMRTWTRPSNIWVDFAIDLINLLSLKSLLLHVQSSVGWLPACLE